MKYACFWGLEKTKKNGDILNMNTQDIDFDYFLENMEELYKQYGHRFVAVKNQSILGVYDTLREALDNTLKTEAIGTFLIQECFDDRKKMVHHFHSNVAPLPIQVAT